ncbi:MAG: hypothetical protein HYU66_21040 [Armatimonadetes bacterium]|nr:hypothetical protein [Armatimonadota bacterium]
MTRLLLALLVAAPVPAAVLYRGDLAGLPDGPARLGHWRLDGGDYTLAGGWLGVQSAQSNPLAALDLKHDGDFTFCAQVRNSRSCHWAALLARGVYRLETNSQFVHLGLLRKTGGEWKLVGQAPDPWAYAQNTQDLTLRLTLAGRHVSGFVDDKKLVEWDDPDLAPAGGDYALMSGWGSRLAWRDIELSDQPDQHEWPRETLPRPAPAGLAETTFVRGSSDGTYSEGDLAALTYRLTTRREQPVAVLLRLRLIDVRGHEVGRRQQHVTLTPGQELPLTVEFTPPARGCFKVALDAGTSAADLGWVEDLGSFTVLPPKLRDMPFDPQSYFGGHMDGINSHWHFQVGRKLGIQWARCHDMLQQGWWTRIQPDGPEQWLFPYDAAQRDLDELGFGTLGEFLWSPKWATSAPPGAEGNPAAYPPKDWDAFARYVEETVRHYRGSIHHWEVWNEPHYAGFWRGTPEEYAKLLAVAYDAAKRADPGCFVFGGGGINPRSLGWIEAMLAAGGGAKMDGFSIHYLEPDLAAEFMPKLRALLDRSGCRGPIWNTEETVASASFLDQLRRDQLEPEARYHYRNACCELVRTYMENLAGGVQRIFYYDQADPWRMKQFPKPRVTTPSAFSGTMWDEGQMLKPVAAAHAALALATAGKRYRERLADGPRQTFLFAGPDRAAAVVYAVFDTYAEKGVLRRKLPEGLAGRLTVIDFMGNESAPVVRGGELALPLSREPVYLVCRGEGALERLRELLRPP